MSEMIQDAQQAQAQIHPQADAQQRMFTQSDVDSIVGTRLKEVREHATQNMRSGPNEDDMRRITREEVEKAQKKLIHEAQVQNEVSTFMNRINAAKDKHPDLVQKLQDMGIEQVPQLVPLLNSVDNTADAIADLAENPHKIGTILSLMRESPHLAAQAVKRLSKSITDNDKAMQSMNSVANTKEPLSQVTASNVSGGADGQMSVKDFRKQSWMRR